MKILLDENRPVGPNQNLAGLQKNGSSSFALSPFLSFIQKEITQTQPKNYTTAARSGILPPSVALKVRHPSVYLASLVLQVFNPCSLSPIAAASSSSASVVFVCSAALSSPFVCRSSSRLRSAVVFVRVLRGSRSLGVHRSRSLAAHRSSSHSRSSGSHAALLQTLRPTRALHLAVELLSFVAAVSSLNPPPDNTLTQHQYSASNSATSDFYYNKCATCKLCKMGFWRMTTNDYLILYR
ncbi:uncharacterized protein LOC127739707 [Arachis duranensis]|uniref:Uncharacterized protein LOC127739707 n=1 Tax=Arachis duranensis TaxID=130453 RepID=A0A9C6TI05_ARADU|nr:uncharacterized protein LOC127739707 [Arachis duranensis]